MKKQTLITLIATVAFALLMAITVLFTMLDAFVFDRALEGTVGTNDPDFTLGPAHTSAPSTSYSNTSESIADATAPNGSLEGTPDTVTSESEALPQYPIIEDMYFKDADIEISIREDYILNENGVLTRYFEVDLKLASIEYLRTHFNFNHKDEIVKATTSELAKEVGAIFAVNGDFFSFRKAGFVIREYETLRDTARDADDDDALFILPDGSFVILDENDPMFENGLPSNVYHCFTFGPSLVENGEITVTADSEVGQHASSNPRTAIGIVEKLHYKIVVSEGRLEEDDGLSLLELASLMQSIGCETAYNLDGGSSTTLYFNGKVINTPGRDDYSERRISDIIYINGLSYSDEHREG